MSATPTDTGNADTSAREGGQVMQMQRRRLLLAIGELLAEGGIESVTIGRISGRAGVSRRTFYELFEDREACFAAAFDQAVESIGVRVADVYGQPGRWRERLRAALVTMLECLDENRSLARMCLVESSRASAEVLERRSRVVALLAGVVDEGRSESEPGGEPPPLTAQGVVGGAIAVMQARLADSDPPIFIELAGPLMGMIVHPYLGGRVSREELGRPVPEPPRSRVRANADPFKDLPIRFTYRTARVMATIASNPGASNRLIADSAGIADEGQTSRLLRRLNACELIENRGGGQLKGEPNAWALTERGQAIHATLTGQS